MSDNTIPSRGLKNLLILLWVGTVLVCIKSIFTDSAYDNAYSMAMSFRHLNGDLMFQTMREPHQTSIYMTDILMFIYKLFVPSLTGVLIFLQLSGTILFGLISIPLYKAVRSVSSSEYAQLACIFFNVFRVKQSPFPEYANLLIGFSVLGFSCLIIYLKDERKLRYLVGLGFSTCLAVLAYPTAIFMFPVIAVLLGIYSKEKKKNILLYFGICFASGVLYISYFVVKIGMTKFIGNLVEIILSDSHSSSGSIYSGVNIFKYFNDSLICIVWIALSVGIAFALNLLAKKLLKIDAGLLFLLSIILTVSELILLVLQNVGGYIWITKVYAIATLLIVVSVFSLRKLEKEEKKLWICGVSISVSTFIAPLLLSNLEFNTICAYLVLGGCVSFVSFRHIKKNALAAGIIICGLVVLHRGLVMYGYTNRDNNFMVYQATNYVRVGPSKGLICDTGTACRFRDEKEDYDLFVTQDDNLLIVGESLFDSTEFMLPKGRISNYSTIDTPIYNEKMIEYFEDYPEKIPTVVAVFCPYGNEIIPRDSYIMSWILEGYEYVGDGRYWTFYRPK